MAMDPLKPKDWENYTFCPKCEVNRGEPCRSQKDVYAQPLPRPHPGRRCVPLGESNPCLQRKRVGGIWVLCAEQMNHSRAVKGSPHRTKDGLHRWPS